MECALFLVTTCFVQTVQEGRAITWVLVKWIQKDRVLFVEPSPIHETGFPVEGRCYWRKKTGRREKG